MKYLLSVFLFLALLACFPVRLHAQDKIATAEELKIEADATFLAAIDNGDALAFYALLDRGADVNAKNGVGNTALMNAAYYDRPEFVRVLISGGADINAVNQIGYTALMNAASTGRTEIVGELLIAGADVNVETNDGWTALRFALNCAPESESDYRTIVELLKTYGAPEKY